MGADNPLTNLVVDLHCTHPDDSFSKVPYEKGHIFLRYLEEVVGGPGKRFICILIFSPLVRYIN